jgi:hypothetical protein
MLGWLELLIVLSAQFSRGGRDLLLEICPTSTHCSEEEAANAAACSGGQIIPGAMPRMPERIDRTHQ